MQEVAEAVQKGLGQGRAAVIGRVIDVKGFSTLPVDEIISIDADGTQVGELLGRPGAETLRPAAIDLLGSASPGLQNVTVVIHDKDVAEIGLSCGGRAEVLLQPAAAIPSQLWSLLADRAPVALVTRIAGSGAGPEALVVDRTGGSWGGLPVGDRASLEAQAVALLAGGRSATQRVEDELGATLIEAWVPHPRLVVVGAGEVLAAIAAQGALLGWETQSTESAVEVGGLLDWAGATAALIVLSHDPAVDAPALRVGLERPVAYVGAMGSRSTQSRRMDRLSTEGVSAEAQARIHRPIGLDLGGRRASEVALAIAAEVLACHCGRDARPLRDRTGAIH